MNGYFSCILGFLILAGCSSQKSALQEEEIEIILGHGPTAEMNSALRNNARKVTGEQFTDSTHMKHLVYYLASDQMKGRETGSPEIEHAAKFIAKLFQQNKIQPLYPQYRDTLKNTSSIAYNMVGFLPGNDPAQKDEYIIIGAHYDHIGLAKVVEGDSIANGANDNASGTATVLELSRYFGKHRKNKRGIIFALFSAEEKGLLGSRHLADRLKKEGVNLYLMLNFEMTGVPMENQDYQTYITGYKKSNLAEEANSLVPGNPVGYLPAEENFSLFQRSDNYPFYSVFGIPSHTFCTFDFTNYGHYHKVTDEAKELDYGHMSDLLNKMIPIVEGLTNSPDKNVKLK